MDDMIYRQAAIDAVRSYYDEFDTSDKSIEERIEDLPSADVVEAVRCKDCKYGEDCGAYESYSCLYYGEEFRLGCLADDFCSRAERRTDEQIH